MLGRFLPTARYLGRHAGLVSVAIMLLLVPGLCFPDSANVQPRIGLVLGGGGARGMAHIGVLKELERMRIPVSCIAGTSMGALIGGLYSTGLTADEMSREVSGIDWPSLFTDDPPRVEKPFHAKQDDFANLYHLELGERNGSLLLPSGATAGYKFEFLLRELAAKGGNYANQDFDGLPIPYRAVATNIENGTSKVFKQGDLVKAMRASMSVPGAIAPVEINGVLYVDGGLLQNLPVDTARRACADVVIAVNVGAGLLPRNELSSAIGVSLQMVNVLMEQNVRASIASLGPNDVLIQPDLGSYSSLDFEHATSLIPIGEEAVRAQADKLRKYSLSPDAYRTWRASVVAREPQVAPVTDVRVAASGGLVNPDVIKRELEEIPGIDLRSHKEKDFSVQNLNDRLEQIYGRGDFERMDYQYIDSQGTRTVVVSGVDKSWGPNYVKFGLGFAADSEQTRFNFSLSHRATWENALGAEWRNDLQLGFHKKFFSEFYQPLSFRSGAFVAPSIKLDEKPIVFFLDGRRYGEYVVRYARAHIDTGLQNKYGQLRLGLFAGHLEAKEDFGALTTAPEFNLEQTGYTGSAVYDQIDNPKFPRQGVLGAFRTFGTLHTSDPEGNYNKSDLFITGANSWGNNTLQLAGYYGRILYGDAKLYDPFLLGGFLRGSGYRMDELIGTSAALARVVYARRIATLPNPVGSGIYVGGSLEATRATLGTNFSAEEKVRPSASVFLGADTFLGPAYLAWGWGLSGDRPSSLYLILGTP